MNSPGPRNPAPENHPGLPRRSPPGHDWPFTFADLLALQGAYDTLTRAGNQTADSEGTWDHHLDRAHQHLGLLLAHSTATRVRFEAEYAARSGVTAEQLHAAGRYPEPCGCAEPGCCGWVMGFPVEDAIFEQATRPR